MQFLISLFLFFLSLSALHHASPWCHLLLSCFLFFKWLFSLIFLWHCILLCLLLNYDSQLISILYLLKCKKGIYGLFIDLLFSAQACNDCLTPKVMACYVSSFFKRTWNKKELWNMHDLMQWMTYSKSGAGILSLSPNVAVIATSTHVPFGSKCNEVSTHGVCMGCALADNHSIVVITEMNISKDLQQTVLRTPLHYSIRQCLQDQSDLLFFYKLGSTMLLLISCLSFSGRFYLNGCAGR